MNVLLRPTQFILLVWFLSHGIVTSFAQQKKVMDFAFEEKGFEFFNFSRIPDASFDGKKVEFHGMTYASGDPVSGCVYAENNYEKKYFVGNVKTGYLNKNLSPEGFGIKYTYKNEMSLGKKMKYWFKSKKKNNIVEKEDVVSQEGFWVDGEFITNSKTEYEKYLREENVYIKRVAYEIIPYLKHYHKGENIITRKGYFVQEKMGDIIENTEVSNADQNVIVFKMATDSRYAVSLDVSIEAKVLCYIHAFHKYTTKDIINSNQYPIYGDTMPIVLKPAIFQYAFFTLKNPQTSLVTHFPCENTFVGIDDKFGKYCVRIAKEEEFLNFKLYIHKVNGKAVDSLFKHQEIKVTKKK